MSWTGVWNSERDREDCRNALWQAPGDLYLSLLHHCRDNLAGRVARRGTRVQLLLPASLGWGSCHCWVKILYFAVLFVPLLGFRKR